jgi:hypothetical protein
MLRRGLVIFCSFSKAASARTLRQPVHAPNFKVGFGLGSVERNPVFVQPGRRQRLPFAFAEGKRVRVKQHIHAPRFEITYHLEKLGIEQRFAQAMQDDALQILKRVYNPPEILEGQIIAPVRPKMSARAHRTKLVAVFGDFDVQAARLANER